MDDFYTPEPDEPNALAIDPALHNAMLTQRACGGQVARFEALRHAERSTYCAYSVLVKVRADPARLAEAKAAWVEAAAAYADVEGLMKGGMA